MELLVHTRAKGATGGNGRDCHIPQPEKPTMPLCGLRLKHENWSIREGAATDRVCKLCQHQKELTDSRQF